MHQCQGRDQIMTLGVVTVLSQVAYIFPPLKRRVPGASFPTIASIFAQELSTISWCQVNDSHWVFLGSAAASMELSATVWLPQGDFDLTQY